MSARFTAQPRTTSKQDSPAPALACALRRLRHDSASTQQDVAHSAGITVASLSHIERGLTNPAWTTVRRIDSALDVSLSELVGLP